MSKSNCVSISRIAKEAGLNPIECPFCHHKVKTHAALDGMFRLVLRYLKMEMTVFVNHFGTWTPRIWKGRKMVSKRFPDMKWCGPRKIVTFKCGKGVSQYLNKNAKRARKMNAAAQGLDVDLVN